MALDARVRYTRMVIREGFIQLNAQKPISQITVKEICDYAQINRSTFYRNFVDVYALRDWIEDEMVDSIRPFIRDKTIESGESALHRILTTMLDHHERYLALHDIPSQRLLSRIIGVCYEEKEVLLMSYGLTLSKKEVEWQFNYVCSGCAAVMINWVKGGMQESPKELAAFLNTLITASYTLPART